MIAALLLAAACQCPAPIDWTEADKAIDEAVRETDRKFHLDKLKSELEEIVRRNRRAFEEAQEQRRRPLKQFLPFPSEVIK